MNHCTADPGDRWQTRVVIVGAGPIGIELAVGLTREGIAFELANATPCIGDHAKAEDDHRGMGEDD